MVAKLGNDLFGEATVRNFASFGIDTSHVRIVDGVSSGVAPIFVEPNGQNRILVVKGANDTLSAGRCGRRLIRPAARGHHCSAIRNPDRNGLVHG